MDRQTMLETTDDDTSRLFDQRARNRMCDVLSMLADRDDAVSRLGAQGYFEAFYDWFPADGPAVWPNSTLTQAELHMLTAVRCLVDEAADEASLDPDDDELIGSGWPRKIGAVAEATLLLMRSRGEFSEEFEEDEPSVASEPPAAGWFQPVFRALAAVRQGRR